MKGGSETYYFSLKKLLTAKGHTVIDFSMQDEKNYPSPYSKYFINKVDYDATANIFNKIKAGFNIIYSFEAKNKFEQLVRDTRPDIIHLHIFQHQLSPSILDVIKKYDIPTIYTAHDLKMLCLNYKMMQHGKICEQCKDGKYFNCAKNKCVKDSFAKSCVNVIEGYIHKWHHSYDVIDQIVTPSAFYRQKFIEFGISPKKIAHIPNFLNTEKPKINCKNDNETYYLYFGRLSEEKGVITLLKAFKSLSAKLYIVGTGPIKEQIYQYIKNNEMDNVHLMGFMSGQALTDVVGNAKAVILPSEWYENGPYSAIEALQLERPIIGANIGGIPELINDNGFLFKSGSPEELRDKILMMEELREDEYNRFKHASSILFQNNYTAEKHYEKLAHVYEEALLKHKENS